MGEKGNVAVIIIISVFLVLGIFLIFIAVKNPNLFSVGELKVFPGKQSTLVESNSQQGLALRGDKIFDGNNILFVNTKDVSAVKFGPDGRTVHFKATKDKPRCAQLVTEVAPNTYKSADYTPPPSRTPWDYLRIGHAYTIPSCSGGGYLTNAPFFVYLEINKYLGDGKLVFENLGNNEKTEFYVHKIFLTGFFDGSENKQNSFMEEPVQSIPNQKLYLYPENDSHLVNKNIVLSFGRLLLMANFDGKLITGQALTDKDYSIIDTSFWFEGNKNNPIILIESGWEGPSVYEAIVDMGGPSVTIKRINNLDKTGINFYNMRKIEWVDNGVILHFPQEEFVDKEIEDIVKGIKNIEDQNEVALAEEKALARLKANTRYKDVVCDLSPGMYSGCSVLFDTTVYKYKSGGQIEKI